MSAESPATARAVSRGWRPQAELDRRICKELAGTDRESRQA